MSLRIIGGELRNRALIAPKGKTTRPTLAIMRKAVFDICQAHIQGARFLDVFAGSGAMAIEALSRGALHSTLIESNSLAINCIRSNLKHLQLESRADLFSLDVFLSLKKLAKQKKAFDILYIDPPYALSTHGNLLIELLSCLHTQQLLTPHAHVFIEEAEPTHLDLLKIEHIGFRHVSTRKFGHSILTQLVPLFLLSR